MPPQIMGYELIERDKVSVTERQEKIRIVLVNTTHPGNIGGAARAMKNMGLKQLYLVQPKLFPHERAGWRAASRRSRCRSW